jgi:hypothetical protein
MWIYSSGFPKSQDIGRSIQRSMGVDEYEEIIDTTKNSGFGQMDVARQKVGQEWSTKETQVGKAKVTDPVAKQWEGWGTALKPAHEPIALARKPIKLSIAKNCQQWGTGALNIDATRIETTDKIQNHYNRNSGAPEFQAEQKNIVEVDLTISDKGRFPSNVLGEILQADYQKYFYCPKVSRKERHIGFDDNESLDDILVRVGGHWCDDKGNPVQSKDKGKSCYMPGKGVILVHGLKHEAEAVLKQQGQEAMRGNNHPTVKPIELMKYLIKLITPPGGTVLDPFNGSGSTGCAAVELGHEYIGCELDPAYVEIAKKRIEAWNKEDNTFSELFE